MADWMREHGMAWVDAGSPPKKLDAELLRLAISGMFSQELLAVVLSAIQFQVGPFQ